MNISEENNESCHEETGEASHWMYAIQAVIAIFIVVENLIMMIAIVHNWYNLTRQHNMYRYLVSLVVADLLYGVILLIHGILTAVNSAGLSGESLLKNELKDIANNLITGVIHGSCFAALASASLLNLVLRMTYTRALARAAAIEAERPRRFSFLRFPSLRCPKTTRVLIGFIWALTLTFIVTPLKIHCHQHITRCTNDFKTYKISILEEKITPVMDSLKSFSAHEEGIGKMDCSFLRPPNSRSYILILNFCITVSWCLMLICNMMTIFIRTTVRKSVRAVSGDIILTLRHKPGLTWDHSSLLVGIITLTMTISTIPYVIFSFTTEGGYLEQRLYYASTLAPNTAAGLEMTTSISSLLNPFIYTAMLGKLRSDIARLIQQCHKKAARVCANGADCITCKRERAMKDDGVCEEDAEACPCQKEPIVEETNCSKLSQTGKCKVNDRAPELQSCTEKNEHVIKS
ncbi:uncharacterized protein LOC120342384 [Styela clava]